MNHPRFGLAYTNKFTKVWNDQGSRAKLDLTIWRPYLAPFGFLGDYPVGHYNEPIDAYTAYIHAVVDDDPAKPALRPPERLEPIWSYPAPSPFPLPPPLNEVKVICRPVAPDGYVACGFVGATARTGQDLTKLIVPGLMCVRSDLTVDLFNPPYRLHSADQRLRLERSWLAAAQQCQRLSSGIARHRNSHDVGRAGIHDRQESRPVLLHDPARRLFSGDSDDLVGRGPAGSRR